jgi:hypothetical protein
MGIETECVPNEPTGDDTDCDGVDDDCDGLTDEDFTDGIDCTIDLCDAGEATIIPDHGVCDDSNPCTDDVCVALSNVAGGCVSTDDDTNVPPDDGIPCTDDICTDGTAEHPISAGACYIEGVCYAEGDTDPLDGCDVCNPAVTQTGWGNTVTAEAFSSGTIGSMFAETQVGPLSWVTSTKRIVSPGFSVWFGNPITATYDTGGHVQGTLWTGEVVLAADALHMLRFQLWLDTEEFTAGPYFDVLRVHVVEDPTGAAVDTVIWDSASTLGGTTNFVWKQISLDLSAFAGKSVQVGFEFDSGDGSFNDFEGAYLDDIEIRTACCELDSDCDDGDPCTADACLGSLCNFTELCADECLPTGKNIVIAVDATQTMLLPPFAGAAMSKWNMVMDGLSIGLAGRDDELNLAYKAFPSAPVSCAVSAGVDLGFHASASGIQQTMMTTAPAGQVTPIGGALTAAMDALLDGTYAGENAVILITDLQASDDACPDVTTAAGVAATLAAAGIEVYVVGVGANVDVGALNTLAFAGGKPTPNDGNDRYFYYAETHSDVVDVLDAVLDNVAAEVCNGIDDDCDGLTDENIPPIGCNAECPGGGKATCVAGTWSACSVAPVPEVCNGNDDDCDGLTDEDWQPDGAGNELGDLCTVGLGACAASGNFMCNPLDVTGNVVCSAKPGLPKPEICDNIDNNCDGVVDNGLTQACSTACGTGFEVCVAGEWVSCTAPPVLPEVCNGVDDDCDGLTDEDDAGVTLQQPCSTACGTGFEYCLDGEFKGCDAPPVLPETCNAVDDDCDGYTDEDGAGDPLLQACFDGAPGIPGEGPCLEGYQLCFAGVWGPCLDQVLPLPEACNLEDDDCDGMTDEQDDGTTLTEPCFTGTGEPGVGVCSFGLAYCEGGVFGECSGAIYAQPEVCDGQDNDCDGETDEDEVNAGDVCLPVPGCHTGLCVCGLNALGEYKCYLD